MIMLIALLLTCVSSAAPVSTEVLKGTAVVDGQLDDAYLSSAKIELDNHAFYRWNEYDGEADMRATVYYLWDDNYLYCCTVVTDDDVLDVGAEHYETSGGNYWMAEAVEHWFDEGYGIFKIHADAFGHYFYIENRGSDASFESSDCKRATSVSKKGYVVEYAMPFEDLSAGSTFTTSMQVNDLVVVDDNFGKGYASGSQTADIEMTLSSNAASVPTPETEPATDAPETSAPADEDPAAPAPAAPATFDLSVIGFVGVAVAGLGLTAIKKRR